MEKDKNFTGQNKKITIPADIAEQANEQPVIKKTLQQELHSLQQANVKLEHSNSEFRQFAYAASHDLQEPLRKIITFCNRLEKNFKNELPKTAGEYIDKITYSARRMSQLIDGLLNFTNVSASEDAFEKVDLNDIVGKVIKDFDLLISEKKADIFVGKLPVIQAAPVLMTQLFYNLVSNALKFSSATETPKVSIVSANFPQNKIHEYPELKKGMDYVEIIVSDNGIGFAPEFAEKIFVIFQRLNEREAYPGTGIGLALCRKIVSYHHGKIFAESKEGEGAAFHIVLPVE